MRILWTFLLLLLAAGTAAAQTVTFGAAGEVVQDRWNPVSVSFRDAADVTLRVSVDQGSLRSGSSLFEWTAHIPGGPGLNVFSDDIFIPAWQSFSWSLGTPARVIASGSLNPRDADPQPTSLILSTFPGRHAARFGDTDRVATVGTADLPRTVAGWDGVARLLVDGTTAPPEPGVIATAAAAGVQVALVTPLPASFSSLLALAGDGWTRYGAGLVALDAFPEVAAADLPGLELAALALTETPQVQAPGLAIVLPAFIIYAVGATLLVRLAGLAGAAGSILVAAVGLYAAWPAIAAPESRIASSTRLYVSAGGLARGQDITRLLDLPGNEVSLAGSWRPVPARPHHSGSGNTLLQPGRWEHLSLLGRPFLTEPVNLPEVTVPLLEGLAPDGTVTGRAGGQLEVRLP